MTATRGELATLTISDRVLRAGGVMVIREGHPVAAHFGSAATELAVCVQRVGLAVRSDLDALELAGPEPWLPDFLSPALFGRLPRRGRPDRRHVVLPPRARPRRRRRLVERRGALVALRARGSGARRAAG